MLHYEKTFKQNKKIQRLLVASNLQRGIKMEDVLCETERGLPRAKLLELMRLDFLIAHKNLLITGATGCGKTHLANVLGNKACIEGYTVKFIKLPVFLEEIQISHQTGTFNKLLTKLLSPSLAMHKKNQPNIN
jgi:DNA replication protein DnaC